MKKEKLFAIDQKNIYNVKDFAAYFEKYKDICIQRDIIDINVWNMDEIEFCIRCRILYWVITIDMKK